MAFSCNALMSRAWFERSLREGEGETVLTIGSIEINITSLTGFELFVKNSIMATCGLSTVKNKRYRKTDGDLHYILTQESALEA